MHTPYPLVRFKLGGPRPTCRLPTSTTPTAGSPECGSLAWLTMSRPADSCSADEKPPVPPEYTVAPTVPASADALPEYNDASSSAAGPSTSTAVGVPEGVQFHIYAASKNPLTRDQVVTGADKKRVLYHLSFSQSLSGRWPGLAIRRGGEGGEEVCQLVKNRMLHDSFDLTFPCVLSSLRVSS